MGRIRDSSTFAAGQSSGIGRYEVPTEVSLPGFGIGIINEDFNIVGIRQVVTKKLEEGGDAEFVRAEGLTIPTALDCSPNYIRGECLCHLHGFPLRLPCY